MDFTELEKLEDEASVELARSNETDLSLLDITTLYPEFAFSDIYGLQSPGVNIQKYLLLYDNVIVNLQPLENEKVFKDFYGISFDIFLNLIINKKIFPVVCFPYFRFPRFYEPLFKLGPFPRSGRLRTFFEVLYSKSKEDISFKVDRLVNSKDFTSSILKTFPNYHGNTQEKIDLFKNSFSSDLYDFQLIGLDEIVEIILTIAEENPDESHNITYDYCDYLVRPLFDNVGGINTFTNTDLSRAKDLYLSTKKLSISKSKKNKNEISARKIESFIGIDPSELVSFVDKEIKINFPKNTTNPIGFYESIDNDPLVMEMRKKLGHIRSGEMSKASVEDLSKIGKEVSQLLKKDAKRLKLASSWSADLILLGSILPSIAGQLYFDKSLASILYGTVYPTLIGTRYDSMKSFAEGFTSSVFEKLLNKPMATMYWHSSTEKE